MIFIKIFICIFLPAFNSARAGSCPNPRFSLVPRFTVDCFDDAGCDAPQICCHSYYGSYCWLPNQRRTGRSFIPRIAETQPTSFRGRPRTGQFHKKPSAQNLHYKDLKQPASAIISALDRAIWYNDSKDETNKTFLLHFPNSFLSSKDFLSAYSQLCLQYSLYTSRTLTSLMILCFLCCSAFILVMYISKWRENNDTNLYRPNCRYSTI